MLLWRIQDFVTLPIVVDPRIEELRTLLPRAMLPDWVRLGARLVRLLRDQHHPASHDALLDRLLAQARASEQLREWRRASAPVPSYPPELPITARKDEIVATIRSRQVVVVAGETGSGKTTQLPKMCLEAGLGIEAKIGCTQPRRVAALSISQRIAEELNVAWGRGVGCKIRFDDRSSPETWVKLMTDGILLAETQGDPLLSEYNAIIIDEAHERSLNIDFLLGYLKGLLKKRAELKLIITSATIDTEAFSKAFDDAPVIEVSGRVYPVDVVYMPFDQDSEEAGDVTFIDAAVNAAERVLCEPGDGDALIFMPGERDIRETGDALKTRVGDAAEVIPLFGRLSSGDQQRVFAPTPRRKVVIATNIAETSLTIPNIRYVIDSGLARISRYNPRTRIKRLPIEPVSQSSANQRKGRSGRVRNGVCIRLYSEDDFVARPPYTQPEIQRANLAEVILRMKAFRLGEIETFPFLNPPSPAAIQSGYRLLQELGALHDDRQLTALGRDLARLPIDPTLGRMLLQSQHEHATRELLIIAAGLSIQDPRERPLEQKETANAAHRRFADPRSDFLSLLNLWSAVHEQWETLRTQNQRRKFCKANFLSYLRMREWQDLHAQLHNALEDLGTVRMNESSAAYEAIHRSILAGLLGHVAQREEKNVYKGVGNRQLAVFPGSVLHDRGEKPSKARVPPKGGQPAPRPPSQPEWIVAGEIVETSRLFARTAAGIDPLWIVELAPHLCKVAHSNPHWSPEAGRVVAEEVTTIYGLEVRRRKVAYGNINPAEATALFIRSALVEENLFPQPSENQRERDFAKASPSQLLALAAAEAADQPRHAKRYPFLEQNRKVRQKIETWQTRARRHDLPDLNEAAARFYEARIENVSSIHELNRFLGGHPSQDFLCFKETDLVGSRDLQFDTTAFPDAVQLANQPVALAYAYEPGEDHDGVTLKLTPSLAQAVSAASVEWAVPGLREPQVAELLRALPKSIRRELMPLPEKSAEIARELQPGGHSLAQDLSRFILKRYGVEVPPAAWSNSALPTHLRPRIEIIGPDAKTVQAGRDLEALRRQLEQAPAAPAGDPPEWTRAARTWEKFGLTNWSMDDLPSRITLREAPALYAWPGLRLEEGSINLRLFQVEATARRATLPAFQRLVELALQKDFAWLQKDLRALTGCQPLLAGLTTHEELQADALENLRGYLLPAEPPPALIRANFEGAIAQARVRLPGLAQELLSRVEGILRLRLEFLKRSAPARGQAAASAPRVLSSLQDLGPKPAAPRPNPLGSELDALVPKHFLKKIPFERLAQLPRYLKALAMRFERASLNPAKDAERARQLAPYTAKLRGLQAEQMLTSGQQALVEEFRWMVEEFKISLFAQEQGTAFPISAKRLDQHLERIRTA